MNEVNTIALSERVKRLERQNKLIKLAGIVVILGMALVLLVGAKDKVPKEIVAEKFRVVDTEGRTRAIIVCDSAGWPSLHLRAEGKDRATLSVGQEGYSVLMLRDERGKPRVNLSVGPEGPRLFLWSENGAPEFAAPELDGLKQRN